MLLTYGFHLFGVPIPAKTERWFFCFVSESRCDDGGNFGRFQDVTLRMRSDAQALHVKSRVALVLAQLIGVGPPLFF